MANKIQTTDPSGACTDLLNAIGIVGFTDQIGVPGSYTCLPRTKKDEITLTILPGNFTAEQAKALFKAAA